MRPAARQLAIQLAGHTTCHGRADEERRVPCRGKVELLCARPGIRAARPPHATPALRPATRGERRASVLGTPEGFATSSLHDRLAIAVPDHALDHATYTDESKSVADHGTWTLLDRTERRFVFQLHGEHGVRRYALIDTGRDWLLHLMKVQPDQQALEERGR